MRRNIVKPSVQMLKAYEPEPQMAKAVLNANENPYDLPEELKEKVLEGIRDLDFNRYPDPASTELIKAYAEYMDVPEEMLIAGSGLDEILSMITNAYIGPGDVVVSHSPGFDMYRIWTEIAGGKFLEIKDLHDHRIDTNGLAQEALRQDAKIIYVCSPNNPTGHTLRRNELLELLETSPSLVVLDEAYADFGEDSFMDLVGTYDNLVVLRTLSKAFRMPGVRCGFAYGPKEIIDTLKKVKSPYNVNALTQRAAQIVLENADELKPAIEEIKESRRALMADLQKYQELSVFPSEANFIYVETPEHEQLQKAFENNDVLVRYYPQREAFRITIGSPEENDLVMKSVKEAFE